MADHIEIANYKKTVEKITNTWAKEVDAANKEIDKYVDALKKMGVKDPLKELKNLLKDKDKKKKDIATKIEKSKKRIDQATANYELNLKLIQPPPKAPEVELIKLPAWVKDLAKKKIKISKNVTIKIDLDIDFKKRKIKKAGSTLFWRF